MERRLKRNPDSYPMFDDAHNFIMPTSKRVDGKYWKGMVIFKDEFPHLLEPV